MVVVIGTLVLVAKLPIKAGELGALSRVGVYEVARPSAGVIPGGTRLFWDATGEEVNPDDDGGARPYFGTSVPEDSPDGATSIRVILGH